MTGFGKILILTGGVLVLTGLVLLLSPKIPFLGRLPGDIHFKRGNFELSIPLATSIVLSLILSAVLWIVNHGGRK